MSRNRPASPAWAAFYERHPEVLATYGESNGYPPNCPCCAPVPTGYGDSDPHEVQTKN